MFLLFPPPPHGFPGARGLPFPTHVGTATTRHKFVPQTQRGTTSKSLPNRLARFLVGLVIRRELRNSGSVC